MPARRIRTSRCTCARVPTTSRFAKRAAFVTRRRSTWSPARRCICALSCKGCVAPLRYQGVDRREPAVGIVARAIHHAEEFLLKTLGDGPAAAIADGDAVDGEGRRDLGGGGA